MSRASSTRATGLALPPWPRSTANAYSGAALVRAIENLPIAQLAASAQADAAGADAAQRKCEHREIAAGKGARISNALARRGPRRQPGCACPAALVSEPATAALAVTPFRKPRRSVRTGSSSSPPVQIPTICRPSKKVGTQRSRRRARSANGECFGQDRDVFRASPSRSA